MNLFALDNLFYLVNVDISSLLLLYDELSEYSFKKCFKNLNIPLDNFASAIITEKSNKNYLVLLINDSKYKITLLNPLFYQRIRFIECAAFIIPDTNNIAFMESLGDETVYYGKYKII